MNSKYYFMFLVCGALSLGACSNGGGGSEDEMKDPKPEPENELSILGGQAADNEPRSVSEKLEMDILQTFGDADNVTTDVVAGDTVQTVIDRANLN